MFLSMLLLLPPVQAQTAAVAKRHAGPFSYDVTQETTLKGTVSSVLTRPSQGMIMGSHLLFATSAGQVDASLGRFGLRGKGALSVAAGQQVEVTGVMKTIKSKQVFLARTVKVGGQVYAIRNAHGFPVSPQARAIALRKATQNREAL
jgi:hypothetical protein